MIPIIAAIFTLLGLVALVFSEVLAFDLFVIALVLCGAVALMEMPDG